MSLQKIIEFNSDNFCLKASVDGSGPVAIVIGSHKYYPRTFSENLKSKLQIICTDTWGLFLLATLKIIQDIARNFCSH